MQSCFQLFTFNSKNVSLHVTIYFCFLVALGFKCRALHLRGKVYHLSQAFNPHSIYTIFQQWHMSQVWWCLLVIPAPGRWRQEDLKFEASLGYTARPCLKNRDIKLHCMDNYSVAVIRTPQVRWIALWCKISAWGCRFIKDSILKTQFQSENCCIQWCD
jgi:hypothetical protein